MEVHFLPKKETGPHPKLMRTQSYQLEVTPANLAQLQLSNWRCRTRKSNHKTIRSFQKSSRKRDRSVMTLNPAFSRAKTRENLSMLDFGYSSESYPIPYSSWAILSIPCPTPGSSRSTYYTGALHFHKYSVCADLSMETWGSSAQACSSTQSEISCRCST